MLAPMALVNWEGEMEKYTSKIIFLQRALIIRNENNMGMVIQNIRADISEQLRQGVDKDVQITSGKILEDYQDTDEFLLLFPAEPINGLKGDFILALSVQSIDPTKTGILKIRRAWMVQSGDQFSVQLEMKANTTINKRWAYTRHPNVRQVHFRMFDDPDNVLEGQVFHQAVFPVQSSTSLQVRSGDGWTTEEFILVPQLIKQSQLIDRCEMLLEALDEKFTAKTGEFLQWSKPLVTLNGIETVASEVENHSLRQGKLISFNITVELNGQEITRKKRIQPLLQHSLTLIQEDGSRQVGTIGISISIQ